MNKILIYLTTPTENPGAILHTSHPHCVPSQKCTIRWSTEPAAFTSGFALQSVPSSSPSWPLPHGRRDPKLLSLIWPQSIYASFLPPPSYPNTIPKQVWSLPSLPPGQCLPPQQKFSGQINLKNDEFEQNRCRFVRYLPPRTLYAACYAQKQR